MDRSCLYNRRLVERRNRMGRRVRIVNRDPGTRVVLVRRIPEDVLTDQADTQERTPQRTQPIETNVRAHPVRAFASRLRLRKIAIANCA